MGASIPKVFLRLSDAVGEPSIIQRTVQIFARDQECEHIIVCVNPNWRARFDEELRGLQKVMLADGGETRQESVRCGVEALVSLVSSKLSSKMCVLVHDAARCCLPADVVRRVVDGVYEHGAVTAAVSVPDALSTVTEGVVRSFVDRGNVWAIQTPQGFWLDELRGAHLAANAAGFVALDDASVVARGREVRVVEGDRRNIKVTHPQDLQVAVQMCREG